MVQVSKGRRERGGILLCILTVVLLFLQFRALLWYTECKKNILQQCIKCTTCTL